MENNKKKKNENEKQKQEERCINVCYIKLYSFNRRQTRMVQKDEQR